MIGLLIGLLAATITVPAGGDLQAALNKAQCGDRIELAAGATYQWEFIFPARACATNPIIITTAGTLPDRRIAPSDASVLATSRSGERAAVLRIYNTAGWTLTGLRFEPNKDGYETLIEVQDGEAIEFDRILFDAPDTPGQKRFIMGNGKSITLRRSYCAGVNDPVDRRDSQCFAAWDGAGPYTVRDNYLEAASENVMFGGANSKAADRVPSDILVEDNLMIKRLSWKGTPRGVKNLFELKQAKRAVIRRNVFQNNWTDAQNGFAILFTVRNDEGGAPWAVVEDVLFEDNQILNVERGLNIHGYDVYFASGRGTRMIVRRNTWQTQHNFVQLGSEIGELSIIDNTVMNGGLWGLLYQADVWPAVETNLTSRRPDRFAVEKLTITGNTGRRYDVGAILGEQAGWEPKAFTEPTAQHPKGHAPGTVFSGNTFTEGGTGPVEPPPPPPNPLIITEAVTQCRFTVKQSPPAGYEGGRVQFKRDGVNFGLSDSTAPYERTGVLTAGTYQFTATWTKTGKSPLTTAAEGVCQ